MTALLTSPIVLGAYAFIAMVSWRMFAGDIAYGDQYRGEQCHKVGEPGWTIKNVEWGWAGFGGFIAGVLWPLIWTMIVLSKVTWMALRGWPNFLKIGNEKRYLAYKRKQDHEARAKDVGLEP